MELVKEALTAKYFTFSGRARRKEFWLVILFTWIVSLLLTGVDMVTGLINAIGPGVGLLSLIFSLAIIIPSLAVGVRRLHDIGRTGWWYLIILIPILGIIALIVFWCSRGTEGTNDYGDDPIATEGTGNA